MNDFSEETLSKTLEAVRSSRRRQRNVRRAAATVAMAIGVASVSYWAIREQLPLSVRDSSEIASQRFQDYPVKPSPTIEVFATEEISPKVILLDDNALDRLLEGRSYGTYVAADGHRRLWVPESPAVLDQQG